MTSVAAVTSVVRKIRLRVLRTTRGFDSRISPIFALSTKWVSICTVSRLGRPVAVANWPSLPNRGRRNRERVERQRGTETATLLAHPDRFST